MAIEGRFYCVLCGKTQDFSIDTTWGCRYGFIDVEDAFCDAHEGVAEFINAQCPGCFESWPDCELTTAGDNGLTDEQCRMLEMGACPCRRNGLYGLSGGSLTPIETVETPYAIGGQSILKAYTNDEEDE